MNYWHVESCNLSECHLPLFELLKKVQKNGRYTAREMYGCRGFVAHHNTDIHGDTAPQDMKRFVKCYFELLTQHRLFSTIKPHALIHGAVVLGLKWRSGKVARYLGFATWILPLHFLRA